MAGFEIWRGGKKEREVALTGREFIIGRDPGAALLLDGDGVSRRHVRVSGRAGRWIAEDLETRNGTFVNGTKEFSKPLRDGDKVQVGDWVLVFRGDDDERAPEGVRKIQSRREREIIDAISSVVGVEEGSGEEDDAEMATSVVSADMVARLKREAAGTKILDSRDAAKLRLDALVQLGPHLRVVGAGRHLKVVRFAPLPFVIGPAPDARLRTTWKAWRGFAVVEADATGALVLRWRGIWPMLTVNGRRVRRRTLASGDVIVIDREQYSYQASSADEGGAPV